MTITYLNEPFNFMAPDINKIRACRAELVQSLALRGTLYLPQLNQQLSNLDQLLHRLDDYIRELLAAAPVALQTQELGSMLARIRDAASLQPPALAESVIGKYQSEINDILENSLNTVDEQTAILTNLLDRLGAWMMGETASFLADHQKQSARLQQTLNALNADLAELQADKQRINDAIKLYDDKSVLDRWIPIFEDVLKIKPTNLQIATLQAGVAGAVNILRISNEMVKYGDLVEARTRAQSLLADKHLQVADYKEQLKTLTGRIDQLSAVQGVEAAKQCYESEVRKIAIALQTFLEMRERRINEPVADYARGFMVQADALSSWLRTLLKNWK